jgi:hypothetical protein
LVEFLVRFRLHEKRENQTEISFSPPKFWLTVEGNKHAVTLDVGGEGVSQMQAEKPYEVEAVP